MRWKRNENQATLRQRPLLRAHTPSLHPSRLAPSETHLPAQPRRSSQHPVPHLPLVTCSPLRRCARAYALLATAPGSLPPRNASPPAPPRHCARACTHLSRHCSWLAAHPSPAAALRCRRMRLPAPRVPFPTAQFLGWRLGARFPSPSIIIAFFFLVVINNTKSDFIYFS